MNVKIINGVPFQFMQIYQHVCKNINKLNIKDTINMLILIANLFYMQFI